MDDGGLTPTLRAPARPAPPSPAPRPAPRHHMTTTAAPLPLARTAFRARTSAAADTINSSSSPQVKRQRSNSSEDDESSSSSDVHVEVVDEVEEEEEVVVRGPAAAAGERFRGKRALDVTVNTHVFNARLPKPQPPAGVRFPPANLRKAEKAAMDKEANTAYSAQSMLLDDFDQLPPSDAAQAMDDDEVAFTTDSKDHQTIVSAKIHSSILAKSIVELKFKLKAMEARKAEMDAMTNDEDGELYEVFDRWREYRRRQDLADKEEEKQAAEQAKLEAAEQQKALAEAQRKDAEERERKRVEAEQKKAEDERKHAERLAEIEERRKAAAEAADVRLAAAKAAADAAAAKRAAYIAQSEAAAAERAEIEKKRLQMAEERLKREAALRALLAESEKEEQELEGRLAKFDQDVSRLNHILTDCTAVQATAARLVEQETVEVAKMLAEVDEELEEAKQRKEGEQN